MGMRQRERLVDWFPSQRLVSVYLPARSPPFGQVGVGGDLEFAGQIGTSRLSVS